MLKDKLGFLLSLVAIVGLFIFGYFIHFDVQSSVVMIVAAFIGGKAAQNIMMTKHIAQDPAADTIKGVEGMDK